MSFTVPPVPTVTLSLLPMGVLKTSVTVRASGPSVALVAVTPFTRYPPGTFTSASLMASLNWTST